ncbi:MAG: DUF488 domain-containing protein [Planctomycetota bacterium]|nr:MAG: DUF488 domain-containing protein [Planctomycetota bacterium]
METRKLIYSFATSRHTLSRFVASLLSFSVRYAVDVRRFPHSSRFPHFCREPLRQALKEAGIVYLHFGKALGGYRRTGYENFTKSAVFRRGLRALMFLAARAPTCFFCAEARWQRCHRRFIADALTAYGWSVLHITAPHRASPHQTKLFKEQNLAGLQD